MEYESIEKMNKTEKMIYDYMKSHEVNHFTVKQVALGISVSRARNNLKGLEVYYGVVRSSTYASKTSYGGTTHFFALKVRSDEVE